MGTPHDRHQRVSALFLATFELPVNERSALLDRECAEDPQLRDAVDRLLHQHAESSEFLREERIGVGVSPLLEVPVPAALLGRQIGGFQLIRVIASGGMGSVFEAEQERPRRTVAVKVMRHGLASAAARRRFDYESQVLAKLRHPGIAQIFEAGTFKDGDAQLPYFAMELIPGARSLTTFAREERLTIPQRLQLFAQVCDAVHHGHQRGVIHRDLKPGNVLVDAGGAPKVIDFGVARSSDVDVAATTLHTQVGQLVGTLQYMSPEQCAGQPDELDVRSDVYSLGVVLYELLCGTAPYDVAKLPLPEALQRVREAAPTRPGALDRSLRGDVETILLKALEKERAQRYQSASDLAGDVRRFLLHEPILARPRSALYHAVKFARRNRVLVTAVVLTVAGLASGLVVAERQRHRAERNLRIAEMINEFLHADLLSAAQPERRGRDTPIGALLDEAAARLPGRFADEPRVASRLHRTIGETYAELGDLIGARTQFELAIAQLDASGDTDEEAERSRAVLQVLRAGALEREGRSEEALAVAAAIRPEVERWFTMSSPMGTKLLATIGNAQASLQLGEQAEATLRESLRIREELYGPNHLEVAVALADLGPCLRLRRNYPEAEAALHRAIGILRDAPGGLDSVNSITVMNNLGVLYWSWGKYEDARLWFEDALPRHDRVLKPDHFQTMTLRGNLAATLSRLGDHERAAAIFEELVPMLREKGRGSAALSAAQLNWARALVALERLEESRTVYETTIADAKISQPENSPARGQAMSGLAQVCEMLGLHADAKKVWEELLGIQARNAVLPARERLLTTIAYASGSLLPLGEHETAERLLRESFAAICQLEGERSPGAGKAAGALARLFATTNRPDLEAEWIATAERCKAAAAAK